MQFLVCMTDNLVVKAGCLALVSKLFGLAAWSPGYRFLCLTVGLFRSFVCSSLNSNCSRVCLYGYLCVYRCLTLFFPSVSLSAHLSICLSILLNDGVLFGFRFSTVLLFMTLWSLLDWIFTEFHDYDQKDWKEKSFSLMAQFKIIAIPPAIVWQNDWGGVVLTRREGAVF